MEEKECIAPKTRNNVDDLGMLSRGSFFSFIIYSVNQDVYLRLLRTVFSSVMEWVGQLLDTPELFVIFDWLLKGYRVMPWPPYSPDLNLIE